jgi:SPP1 gp7 family putative phage head morphogenesis protein
MVAAFTVPANEKMLAEARTMASRQAAEYVTNVTASELRNIGEAIARGLEEGKGPREIAKTLDMVKELDAVSGKRLEKYIDDLGKQGLSPEEIEKRAEKMRQKLLKERKDNISQTETANAIEESQYIEAQAAGRKYKTTITSGDARVSDICQGNEAQGWIPIAQAFQSGHMHAPHHPKCRCATTYGTFAPNDFDRQRAEARSEKTKAAKESAEKQKQKDKEAKKKEKASK